MKKILLLCALFIHAIALDATIEIIKDITKLPVIMVENLGGGDLGAKTYKMLVADLKVSGHFNVLENAQGSANIDYAQAQNSHINLVAKLETAQNGSELGAKLTLYDINIKQAVLSKQYNVNPQSRYPFLAHKMAIDINGYIKAPSIDWMNRFVVFSKYTKPNESHIVVADYTLNFQSAIIKSGLNIFPKWANKEQSAIYFTKYLNAPTLVKYDIFTGETTKLITSDGMLIASDVSADGSKILLTMSPNGQPDIYLFNANTRTSQKLTNYSGIDVGANFINNEKAIMFISDRLGYPNIFSLDLSSRLITQLVYHGRNNSSASAHGDYIVYSSRESENEFGDNLFNLYLISTKSDFIRRLTANGVNQLPRFSSDGGSIMFLKHAAKESSLGIIRLNYNKSWLFPLANEKIQAIDW